MLMRCPSAFWRLEAHFQSTKVAPLAVCEQKMGNMLADDALCMFSSHIEPAQYNLQSPLARAVSCTIEEVEWTSRKYSRSCQTKMIDKQDWD